MVFNLCPIHQPSFQECHEICPLRSCSFVSSVAVASIFSTFDIVSWLTPATFASSFCVSELFTDFCEMSVLVPCVFFAFAQGQPLFPTAYAFQLLSLLHRRTYAEICPQKEICPMYINMSKSLSLTDHSMLLNTGDQLIIILFLMFSHNLC